MIYISYHHSNLSIVLDVLIENIVIADSFWFDKYEVSPLSDWEQQINSARIDADLALVFLSKTYAHTHYCLNELQHLQATDTQLVAIIMDDFQLSTLSEVADFAETININHIPDTEMFKSALGYLFADVGLVLKPIIVTERQIYIKQLINDLELRLQNTITNQAMVYPQLNQYRPRGYLPQILEQGVYKLSIDGEELFLENLISLIKIHPHSLICGQLGVGKTTIALMLALWSLHAYQANESTQLPIYLDLSDWKRTDTFEQFFSSHWPLVHDWRSWLKDNSCLFIIDVDRSVIINHPDYMDQISSICILPEQHATIVITPECSDAIHESDLFAIVTVEPLSDTLISEFVTMYLPNRQAETLISLYQGVEENRLERQIDYVSLLIEFMSVETDETLQKFPPHFASHIIWIRWQKTISPLKIPITFEEFLDVLSYLAWQMLQSSTPHILAYGDALNLIGDSAMLEIGLELNILRTINNRNFIRFDPHIFQYQLAAYILFEDGIYKHLGKPQFNMNSMRIPTKWDRAIISIYTICKPEQYDEIIETVSEIDPFLATEFVLQDTELYHKYAYQLIDKLVDIRIKNPESHAALVEIILSMPFVNHTVNCLVRLMSHSSWSMQMLFYNLSMQLLYTVPDEVIKQVRTLDRYFDDAVLSLSTIYPQTDWVTYLFYLLKHPDPTIQRNAISLAGATEDKRVLPALFSLLATASKSIVVDTISAILKITDEQEVLSRLLVNLPEDIAQPRIVMTIFAQMGREFSVYLIDKLYSSASGDFREFFIHLSQVSDRTVKQIIAQYVSVGTMQIEDSRQDSQEDRYTMKLSKILLRRLQKIQDETNFDTLLADMRGVFTDKSKDETVLEMTKKPLVERVKSSLVQPTVVEIPTSTDNQIPTDIFQKLAQPEWLVRYKALYELAGYPAEQITPYLIRTIQDDANTQVRIGAIKILSSLSLTNEILSALLNALQDEDRSVIDATTEYIKTMDQFETSRIISMLKHPNLHTVVAAIEILAIHHNADVIEPLILMLEDERKAWAEDEPIGFYAAKALRVIGTTRAIDAVEQSTYFNQPTKVDVIPPAIEHSEQTSKNYTLEQKVHLTLIGLRSNKWEVMQKASRYLRKLAQSLRGIDDTVIITMIEDALVYEKWTVRQVILEALAWIQSPTSVSKITPLLQDDNWMVQVAAIHALTELNAKDTAPQIADLLQNSNSAVCEAAAEGLGLLKNPVVIEDLQQALTSDDEFVRLSAIQSIHQILKDDAAPYLLSSLHDPYNHIRWFAVKHLCKELELQEVKQIAKLLPDKSGPAWEKLTISDYALKILEESNLPESKQVIDAWIRRTQ